LNYTLGRYRDIELAISWGISQGEKQVVLLVLFIGFYEIHQCRDVVLGKMYGFV
jgi:hypothetical protein